MTKMRYKFIIKEAGFTLIELLMIISLLGILAAIVIPRIGGINDKARLAEAQTAISSIKNSLELIYTDKNSYADTDTSDTYKTAKSLLADTNLNDYLDNLFDK